MRILYVFFKLTLGLAISIFYRKIRIPVKNKGLFSRTIYVSNHPNSFMDPILLGSRQRAIVHYMVRSDVFKWFLRPIFWATHMLPIFRQQDGENTREKNIKVFGKVNRALRQGRNILIFAEGFTDDTPILGLKPLKKGAVRMGFTALEACNWEKKIFVATVGINYSDRNKVGSDILINNGEEICLNDYKDVYLENPSKVITDLTKMLEQMIKDVIISIELPELYGFAQKALKLSGKGLVNHFSSSKIDAQQRYFFSKELANRINEKFVSYNSIVQVWENEADAYFSALQTRNTEDRFVIEKQLKGKLSNSKYFVYLILGFPLALIGFIHTWIPYLLAKNITEKVMKRPVFWGAVKLVMGTFLGSLINIPVLIFLGNYFSLPWYVLLVYFFSLGFFWRVAYDFVQRLKEVFIRNKTNKMDLSDLYDQRKDLVLGLKKFGLL